MCISLCLTQCLPVEEEEGREREGKEWIEATDRESKETEKKQGKDTQNLSCLRRLSPPCLSSFSLPSLPCSTRASSSMRCSCLLPLYVHASLSVNDDLFMSHCFMPFHAIGHSIHFFSLLFCHFLSYLCQQFPLCLLFQFQERNITGLKQLIPRVKWEKGK